MNALLASKILNLHDGDHLCLFYDNDPVEQMPALLPFIRQGLSKNEQFIYIADDQTVDELMGRLRQDGVDVERESARGRLKLCTGEQWCQSGELSSEARAEQVRGFVRDAIKSGFKGIRFAVEMTWTLGSAMTADKLAHWEATVNTLFVPEFPGRVICQYNRAKLAPDVLLAALRTHPMAILGDDVCCNHFYEAPLILDGNGHIAAEGLGKRVDWMMSQLKRAQAAELERESTLRHEILTAEAERQNRILSLVPVGVYACDNEGRIIFYNKKAAELWGREPKLNDSRERFCGCCKVFQPDGTFVLPEQTPMAVALRERKSFRNTEAVVERPDGSRFTASVNIDVLAEADGRVTGAINVFQDITDLKRSSEILRQREQKLQAIVNGTPECVKIVAADGALLEMNEAGLGLVEAESSAEVLGRSIYDIIAAEHRERYRAMNERVCGGETAKLEFEIVGLKGTRRWMETRATPIIDPTSGRRVQLAITRDISEKKRAKELLEQAIDERTAALREAVAQLEEFSYTVSHDLRAPLRGMQAYSEAILEDFPDALPKEAVDYLKRIATNAKRLDKMVLDVLTFSRLARADFKLERVNLDRLLRQMVEQYPGLQAPLAEIRIDPLPDVVGHEPSLTQAFSNLLSNSVKFVEPGVKPDVRVWAERNDGHIRLCVADNGIGVDPKFQHRLFRMFERIHPNSKKEGTGVGLAIVKKAVERMGGTVGMDSDGKNGSRFWFEIPRWDRLAMTTTDQTILLVEDEEDDVFIMRRALKDAQVANPLQVVTDGQQALDYLAGHGEYADRTHYPLPFLMFLDLKLPYFDGFEILTRIRQQSALESIMVVVLTSSAELRDKDRACQLGARSYLIKPPTVKTLNEVLNALESYWLAKTEVTPIVSNTR